MAFVNISGVTSFIKAQNRVKWKTSQSHSNLDSNRENCLGWRAADQGSRPFLHEDDAKYDVKVSMKHVW